MSRRFSIGIDLGQSKDPSALAVCECSMQRVVTGSRADWLPVVEVTFLQRLPLGTPYPEVVARIAELARRLYFVDPSVCVDAGGVGRAVVDELRSKGVRNVVGVTATGGNGESLVKRQRNGSEDWNVAKSVLLGGLAALVFSGRLRVAQELHEASQLLTELGDLEARTSAAGRESYAVSDDADGHHADLVSAVALAAWRVQQRPKQPPRRFTHNLGVS